MLEFSEVVQNKILQLLPYSQCTGKLVDISHALCYWKHLANCELMNNSVYYRGILSYKQEILQELAVEESLYLGKFLCKYFS